MTYILNGFLQNLLITLLSSVIPLGMGILLSFFAGKKSAVEKVFWWVSIPFEAICPITVLLMMFFGTINISSNTLITIIFAFSVAFLGFMPARYDRSFSIVKNILLNGLRLISTVFKWSFCVGYIGHSEALYATRAVVLRTYTLTYYLIPFAAAFIFLLIIEVLIRIIKQFTK